MASKTDRIETIATEMYTHCIRKDADQATLTALKDEAVSLLRQHAESIGVNTEGAEPREYKRQSGSIPHKCADNARLMLRGSMNRMEITDSESEERIQYESALYNINVIYDEAMEACGFYKVPVWVWKNPIKL